MIPKRIYQIWFKKSLNTPIPDRTLKFINNVKEWCSYNSYEYILIDDDSDIKKECLQNSKFCKKYANRPVMLSDYIRIYTLYKYGGIYLDCDVKIREGFDSFLDNQLFIGQEPWIEIPDRKFYRFDVGTIGCECYNKLLAFLLSIMDGYLCGCYLEGPSAQEVFRYTPYAFRNPIDMWVAIPDLLPFIIREIWNKEIVAVHDPKILKETTTTFEVFDETCFSANGKYTQHCFHTTWL